MNACQCAAARWSYAHRGRGPDAGRPRGSNWDNNKLLAASGKLGACHPLPLSGLTVTWPSPVDLTQAPTESLARGSFGTFPPGPRCRSASCCPRWAAWAIALDWAHRQRLLRPSPRRNGDRAPKRDTELCSSGTIGAHAQNGETATETNGDKGAAARKPQQPLQSPMATFKTLVVLSILALLAVANAQNATRPTRGPITPPTRPPNTDRPSRVRSPPRHAMRRPRCMLRFPSRFSVLFVFRRPSS